MFIDNEGRGSIRYNFSIIHEKGQILSFNLCRLSHLYYISKKPHHTPISLIHLFIYKAYKFHTLHYYTMSLYNTLLILLVQLIV